MSDGQVLRIRGAKTTKGGHRWLRVVTADGRLGWLKQTGTLPTRRPDEARRWNDVDDTGRALARKDRSMVRPRPS